MALKDLVINNQQISTEIVEKILKDRVDLIQEERMVHLNKKSVNLPNRQKVLLFLAGGKAWELIDGEIWNCTPGSMEQLLGIPGNTLRPILKEFADNFFIKSEKGKYQILYKGIYELETMLEKKEDLGSDNISKKNIKKDKKSIRKTASGPSKSQAMQELIDEGFFSNPRELTEILIELGRRGISTKLTSLPSYILPLVRKKVLTREHKIKGKGKVWVYKLLK